jgi:hypothetical protein
MKMIYRRGLYPTMFEEVVRRLGKEVLHESSRPENAIECGIKKSFTDQVLETVLWQCVQVAR